MVLAYHNFIVNVACINNRRVINTEENESWERLNVYAVPLVRSMGKGTEGLQNMLGRIHARYEEVAFAVPV